MPPGIWPSPPGSRPPSGAHPSHPIYNPAYPDQGLPQPGAPVDPGYGIPETGVPRPSHPIYFPPEAGHPAHPIALPPDLPPALPDPDNRPIDWKTGWTAETGWIVVGIPQVDAPTPST
jgi:hypothetical protein